MQTSFKVLIYKMKNYIEKTAEYEVKNNRFVYCSYLHKKMKISNICWSCWTCLLITFPNLTRKYVLHPTFAVRMYPFYGHFNAYNGCIALFSFISPKINLHWIPHTSRHIKTTPSSSFYIGYCQQYSDYKTFGDLWRPF